MEYVDKFDESEIPFEALGKFGITQQMIDDLPEQVMLLLTTGQYTPVMVLNTSNEAGQTIETKARISLVRNTDGSVSLRFAPYWESADLEEFSLEEQQKLMNGLVIMREEGTHLYYAQLDTMTNQVMRVPVELIQHNIDSFFQKGHIDETNKQHVINGQLAEIRSNTSPDVVTVGIDLNETDGLRIVSGDAAAWQEEAYISDMPEYNFGFYGCWISDHNGHISYVPEDKYTEEIQSELMRTAGQNAVKSQMRR